MPPRAHALLGASSSNIWINCPPSIRLGEKLAKRIGDDQSKDTPFTIEGTKAHELCEIKLRHETGEYTDAAFAKHRKAWEKKFGEADQEMEDATDYYRDIVVEKLMDARRDCPDAELMLEVRLDYTRWVKKGFGTSDAVIVSDGVLEVIDFKYGKGVEVSAIGNSQARLYGLGALDKFGVVYDFPVIRNTIIQPRLDNLSSEQLSRQELLEWGDQVVKPAAALAWAGKGDFKVGDHCRFCPVKQLCAARAAESLTIFHTGLDAPPLLSDRQIPEILRVAKIAEAWIKDLKDYARTQAEKGQKFKGYKLVHGRGTRSWTDEAQVREALLGAGITPDQMEKTELLSVSQMEKALGKKEVSALLSDLIFKSDGALTLVPEDDSRPEANPGETDFADLVNTI